jgi:hypothetical protein
MMLMFQLIYVALHLRLRKLKKNKVTLTVIISNVGIGSLDEMIWAFEELVDDTWEEQYFSGKSDIVWVPSKELDAKGRPLTYEMKKGSGDTRKYDKKGWTKHSARIDNGTRLFGKYFRALWD